MANTKKATIAIVEIVWSTPGSTLDDVRVALVVEDVELLFASMVEHEAKKKAAATINANLGFMNIDNNLLT